MFLEIINEVRRDEGWMTATPTCLTPFCSTVQDMTTPDVELDRDHADIRGRLRLHISRLRGGSKSRIDRALVLSFQWLIPFCFFINGLIMDIMLLTSSLSEKVVSREFAIRVSIVFGTLSGLEFLLAICIYWRERGKDQEIANDIESRVIPEWDRSAGSGRPSEGSVPVQQVPRPETFEMPDDGSHRNAAPGAGDNDEGAQRGVQTTQPMTARVADPIATTDMSPDPIAAREQCEDWRATTGMSPSPIAMTERYPVSRATARKPSVAAVEASIAIANERSKTEDPEKKWEVNTNAPRGSPLPYPIDAELDQKNEDMESAPHSGVP